MGKKTKYAYAILTPCLSELYARLYHYCCTKGYINDTFLFESTSLAPVVFIAISGPVVSIQLIRQSKIKVRSIAILLLPSLLDIYILFKSLYSFIERYI